jgi:4,5-dihydroxyphthalate decarboxylase
VVRGDRGGNDLSDRIILKTSLGRHDYVRPLKDGAITSERIQFDFVEYDPLPKAFRAMVRGADIDVGEIAITTHLLALEFKKPLSGIPIQLWRRLHHSNLVCLTGSDIRSPKDLEGKKVGVRAYSQTTGVWIRGILKTQYGVDLDRITWVTIEDAHVAEYQDPPNAVRNVSGKSLREMLFSGELAAIMGEREVDPSNVRTVVPNAAAEAEEWSRRTGLFPVNHVLAVRTELLLQYPWLRDELMRVLDESRIRSGAKGVAAMPYGLDPNRHAMQTLCDFAADQKLTSKVFQLDEVFPAG